MKGKTFSEEHRRKLSESLYGQTSFRRTPKENYLRHRRAKIIICMAKVIQKKPEKKCRRQIRAKPSQKKPEEKCLRQRRGKTRSEETKRKISAAMKGKTLSEEHKRKISESRKGENHPMYGKTRWNKGKTLSEETRI